MWRIVIMLVMIKMIAMISDVVIMFVIMMMV